MSDKVTTPRTFLSVQVPRGLRDALHQRATRELTTISTVARQLIAAGLERPPVRPPKKDPKR